MIADPPSAGSPIFWADDGQPRSRIYGDVYFSTEDGLAETRKVFLQGCGLPDAWRGRSRFVVGELGFGTGLNILALMDLWRKARDPGARLHIFSTEAHPLARDEAARALARWPELSEMADDLLAAWPGAARGVHRVDLPRWDVILDLAVGDAQQSLADWTGRADAWFLDGFSPALNPQMWTPELMALVAARSAPGARAATFTVAGAIRRGLQAAGFSVDKRPGHGRKRERLEAVLPGAATDRPSLRVAVIGAGVAGASAARALRALGVDVIVLEATAPGAGASGNPAALATPRLDAGLGPVAELSARAFARAVALYATTTKEAVIARGVLQLASGERDPGRFATIAASDLFEPGALALLGAEQTSGRIAEAGRAALDMRAALVVEPAVILAAWCGPVMTARVGAITLREEGWDMLDPSGGLIAQADAVILAAGQDSAGLVVGLPLTPVRGQASWASDTSPAQALAWGGYALPMRDGVLFGATHDRGDVSTDTRESDHLRNLETLAAALPALAARLSATALEGRASVRATTPDRLPLAGPVEGAPGLFALTGFGSRGFSLAPLLAEHVAALAVGAPSPLPASQAALVDPGRFAARAARRGRNSVPAAAETGPDHQGTPP